MGRSWSRCLYVVTYELATPMAIAMTFCDTPLPLVARRSATTCSFLGRCQNRPRIATRTAKIFSRCSSGSTWMSLKASVLERAGRLLCDGWSSCCWSMTTINSQLPNGALHNHLQTTPTNIAPTTAKRCSIPPIFKRQRNCCGWQRCKPCQPHRDLNK